MLEVRPLIESDLSALMALRRESLLAAPLAFGSSPEDDRFTGEAFVRELLTTGPSQGRAMFGALLEGQLVGIVGLVRGQKRKGRHLADVVSMYVAPQARGRGAGMALLQAAIAQGRRWGLVQIELCVTEDAEQAQRLYARAGFILWGTAPNALRHQGQLVDEHHMSLPL